MFSGIKLNRIVQPSKCDIFESTVDEHASSDQLIESKIPPQDGVGLRVVIHLRQMGGS